ncbi:MULTISPECIES: anthranilate synthase component I family protein [unclassified Brevundimonas]|uniref:anthranilate synthase component I family protein n=1 Tax=unclassified Brevundimonas TaxID=2622653 RepID=UPI0025C4BE12|nr:MULTISPECIES: chorismate-binding protein [unclassified Brevundimonas]
MAVVKRSVAWVDPLSVANGLRSRPHALALIAGANAPLRHGGRWSFVAAEADLEHVTDQSPAQGLFDVLRHGDWDQAPCVGLVSYDAGARVATGPRAHVWPDLMLARYPAWLAFDHLEQRLWACGWGGGDDAARGHSLRAEAWLACADAPEMPAPPSDDFNAEAAQEDYCRAVADVVRRIGEGELFQANVARAWSGRLRPEADPFAVFLRLSSRGAAYGAWWRMGGRALVSNSPELFLMFDATTRRLEARPIKGTRPRHSDPVADRQAAQELLASEKDRAENLMIVDLMRNDLARVAQIGSVAVDELWGLEQHATVHHLTSVVSATARQGTGWADVLDATFPPGSITGAPKNQAMKVIAALEPPRGAWCGTLFARGFADGALTMASVLIRTAFFERSEQGWRWRALAGAGITAGSDPHAELEETGAKISALAEALAGRTVRTGD